MHTLYRRLASTTPTADIHSNTGDTDSQSVSPSVTPNYDVIDPNDIVLTATLQWQDAILPLGCSLLLIQHAMPSGRAARWSTRDVRPLDCEHKLVDRCDRNDSPDNRPDSLSKESCSWSRENPLKHTYASSFELS